MMKEIIESIIKSDQYLPQNITIYKLKDDQVECIYYSSSLASICGYSEEEFMNINHNNLGERIIDIPKEAHNPFELLLNMDNRNTRIGHKTKEYVWIRFNNRYIGEEDGYKYVVCSFLGASDEMIEASTILNVSNRGVVLFDKETLNVLYANDAFLKIGHIKRAECIGKPCHRVICGMGDFDINKCICLNVPQDGSVNVVPGGNGVYYAMSCRLVMIDDRETIAYFLEDVSESYRVSQTLKQTNIELNRILNTTTGGITRFNVKEEMMLTYATPQFATMLGYDPSQIEELMKNDIFYYIHPSDHKLVTKLIKQVIETGEYTISTYRLRNFDNTYSWFKGSFYRDYDEEGEPFIYNVLTDITKENKFYLDALNHTNEIVLISDWESREILYANKAAAKISGQSLEKLIGQKCSQVPHHCDEVCSFCKKDQLTHDTLYINEHQIGNKNYVSKGQRIQWNGREAYIEYVSDITAQKLLTKKAVFEKNMMVTAIRKTFPLCIISNLTKNTYEIIEYDNFNTKKANESGIFDQLIEVGASTIPIEDRQKFQDSFCREGLLKAYNEGLQYVSLEHRQIGDDGQVHWNHTTVVFVEELYNEDLYTVTFTESIDHQKKIEKDLQNAMEEAVEANAARNSFFARMSHDMRTPLNGIIGSTHLAMNLNINDDKLNEHLHDILFSSDFLLSLINDILDLSKIESGFMELVPEVYPYSEFIDNMTKMVEPICSEKNITLNMNPLPGDSAIYVDKMRFQQIFFNIFSNAVKYTPEGGTIDHYTEITPIDDHHIDCRCHIIDNGIGMSKEFQKHLFDPYSRERQKTTSIIGTGLGLSIANSLAHMMGGELIVTSELGKGTEVIIHTVLETRPLPKKDKTSHLKTNKDEGRLKDKRILLCEDHPLNQKVAKNILMGWGIIVDSAVNGEIGVQMFKDSPKDYYDLILMDIRMPVMDGLDATRHIRQLDHPNAKSIPIIALTANAYQNDVRSVLEAGMNEHMAKPMKPDVMKSIIMKYI